MRYTLYKVVNKRTSIEGYWLNDKDKLYKDSITLKRYKSRTGLNRDIKGLFKSGQEAVFYKIDNRAYIIDKAGHKTILTRCITLFRSILSDREVKDLLRVYGGLTIFKGQGSYTIEIWEE